MTEHERAFERLRLANPEATRPIEGKPTAFEMLAVAQRRRAPQEPTSRRGLVVAAAAFLIVLVIAIPTSLWLGGSEERPPVVTQLPAPTTAVPTTTPRSPTTAPPPTVTTTTSGPEAIDPEIQALVDEFVAVYNGGDVEGFAAFLHPDFRRDIVRERALEPQALDTVLGLYEIDATLNTEITLACTLGFETVICETLRFDDLHRVLGIGPTEDRTWRLEFQDGLLVTWGETRQNFAVEYELAAQRPFLQWVRENHPEIQSPFPFVDGDWVVRDGIVAEMSGLVDEWAADLGVTLEE